MMWILDWFWRVDPDGPTLLTYALAAAVFLITFVVLSLDGSDYGESFVMALAVDFVVVVLGGILLIMLAFIPWVVFWVVATIAVTYTIHYLINKFS